jgi:uncharacterized DUF497 family protein
VFADPLARIFPDEEHSVDELREIIIGHSAGHQLILVNFRGITIECEFSVHASDSQRAQKL